MNTYELDGEIIDSIELKCMVVSRGVKVRRSVYKSFSQKGRLQSDPRAGSCFLLSDGTIIQLTDLGFRFNYLRGGLSWDNSKLLRTASLQGTDFALDIDSGRPALLYKDQLVDHVVLPPATDFYKQTTSSGVPFMGNARLQGLDWVTFQSLWPCEYAASGKPCQFCFQGADFESLGKKEKPLPEPLDPSDVGEIVDYAFKNGGCNSVLLTGGCTFSGALEEKYIPSYLNIISKRVMKSNGEVVLCITPPVKKNMIDQYFDLGADRITCSLEVWNENVAKVVTPGKIQFTTRQRQLETLEYIAEKFGPGKASSNFVIGLEPLESLEKGAAYLAERGILPTASIWRPMGRPVQGTMKAPEVDFYRRVKEAFAGLYDKYQLKPPSESAGLDSRVERDIWKCTNVVSG